MPRPKGYKLCPEAWRDILRLTGLTLTIVAEDADVPRATISGLVGQHAGASAPMTKKIADVLGVNPITLFPTLRPSYVEAEADEVAA